MLINFYVSHTYMLDSDTDTLASIVTIVTIYSLFLIIPSVFVVLWTLNMLSYELTTLLLLLYVTAMSVNIDISDDEKEGLNE